MNKAADKGQLGIDSEHKLRSENLPFDIDVWYPLVEEFTFETRFIPLQSHQAQAIVNFYQTVHNGRRLLTTEQVDLLQSLESELDSKIKQWFPMGCFLRLCGRSPKDGEPLNRDQLREQYLNALNGLLDSGAPLSSNTKLRAIGSVAWMKVTNGKEALSLLLSSERVFADLHDWLKYGEPEQIVLRKWEPQLTLKYEFRAFVYRNRITAISQYDHYAIYPELRDLRGAIQDKIQVLWRTLHSRLRCESYVADFAYLEDQQDVLLIELSPFLPCTGPALFSWTDDIDVLKNGPLTFRINEKIHPQIDDLVEANWEDRWKGDPPKYWEFYPLALFSHSHQHSKGNRRTTQWHQLFIVPFSIMAAATVSFPPSSATDVFAIVILALSAFVLSLLCQSHFRRQCQHPTALIFVYGTLKSKFHWNNKFLGNSILVGNFETVGRLPLVLGACNVPYLLMDITGNERPGEHVQGEVWEVDTATLQRIDEYEGITKGYYTRRMIEVCPLDTSTCSTPSGSAALKTGPKLTRVAYAYFKTDPTEQLRRGPFLKEYSLEFHKKMYKPIEHIRVKQNMYLGRPFDT